MGNLKVSVQILIELLISIFLASCAQLIPSLSAAIESKWENTFFKLLQLKLKIVKINQVDFHYYPFSLCACQRYKFVRIGYRILLVI